MALIGVKEVVKLTGRSSDYCYQLMKKLRAEQEKKGFLTFQGRIEESYLKERLGIPK